jgi:hypothetical protein
MKYNRSSKDMSKALAEATDKPNKCWIISSCCFIALWEKGAERVSQDDFLAACSGGKGKKTLQAKRENSVDMSYLPGGGTCCGSWRLEYDLFNSLMLLL